MLLIWSSSHTYIHVCCWISNPKIHPPLFMSFKVFIYLSPSLSDIGWYSVDSSSLVPIKPMGLFQTNWYQRGISTPILCLDCPTSLIGTTRRATVNGLIKGDLGWQVEVSEFLGIKPPQHMALIDTSDQWLWIELPQSYHPGFCLRAAIQGFLRFRYPRRSYQEFRFPQQQ